MSAVIQTPDPFSPDWDQRKAEAAAAGLAVVTILEAASPIAWTVTSARTVDIDTARGPLTVTRGALLIAQQDIELGASDFARVRGRYPSGASGFVLLDESQVLTLSAALLAAP